MVREAWVIEVRGHYTGEWLPTNGALYRKKESADTSCGHLLRVGVKTVEPCYRVVKYVPAPEPADD